MLTKENETEYINIKIKGIVQGLGFRPFLYRKADQYQLKGFIRNEGSVVRAVLTGPELQSFLQELKDYSTDQDKEYIHPGNSLRIEKSIESLVHQIPLLKDLSPCEKCLEEYYDPKDRRHLFPFISCHNCGPRLSIIESFPYDRERTSYKDFPMCSDCEKEYSDPSNRRFFHQAISCPNCGPKLSVPREKVLDALSQNKIIAFKGIGGFQLIGKIETLDRLRKIKQREHKAFACMKIDHKETIDILKEKPNLLSPDSDSLGIMGPSTAFHNDLCKNFDELIVTSANVHGPMITEENEELHSLCDLVVTHKRKIYYRLEDSVTKNKRILRAGRALYPLQIPFKSKPLIALGGDLKNSFLIANGEMAILFPYMGNLHHPDTFSDFKKHLDHSLKLLNISHYQVICDAHPGYLSHRLYKDPILVQHHLAHGASVMMEHNLERALALCFDGTGYGDDGMIWGAETLLIDRNERSYERLYSLSPWPLLGNDQAIKEPYRNLFFFQKKILGESPHNLDALYEREHLFTKTSSMGRLFDAVSCYLLPQYQRITYEGQAAIALENLALNGKNSFFYPLIWENHKLNSLALFSEIFKDKRDKSEIAYSFHLTIAKWIESIVEKHSKENIVLSGGVFQNELLTSLCLDSLKDYKVFMNQQVSCNDSGLCLGQLYWGSLYA